MIDKLGYECSECGQWIDTDNEDEIVVGICEDCLDGDSWIDDNPEYEIY